MWWLTLNELSNMGNLTNSQIVFLTKHQIKYSVLTISKLSFFVILVYLVVTYSSFSLTPVWLKSWFEVYPQINFLVGELGPNLENQGSIRYLPKRATKILPPHAQSLFQVFCIKIKLCIIFKKGAVSDCQTHTWSKLGPGNGFICSFFHIDLVGGSENNRPVVSWKVSKLFCRLKTIIVYYWLRRKIDWTTLVQLILKNAIE